MVAVFFVAIFVSKMSTFSQILYFLRDLQFASELSVI